MTTSIEWARNADGSQGETWNPIRARRKSDGKTGHYCQKVSPGCKNCYAESMNRWRGNGAPYTVPAFEQVELYLDEETLIAPLHWKKPRTVFVCSMTDLYADFVPDEWLDQIHAVMALTPRSTYQCLTKRPERRLRYFQMIDGEKDVQRWVNAAYEAVADLSPCAAGAIEDAGYPLPNVWQGTTVCNQDEANRLILPTLQTPAALHFLSCEPLLGAINLRELHCSEDDCDGNVEYLLDALTGRTEVLHSNSADIISDAPENPRIEWVIVGGESGQRARPMHLQWARSLRNQCSDAGTPFFFKQWGEWTPELPPNHGVPDGSLPPERVRWMNADGRTAPCGNSGGLQLGPENLILRVGKEAAGALLDGREYREMPEVRQ